VSEPRRARTTEVFAGVDVERRGGRAFGCESGVAEPDSIIDVEVHAVEFVGGASREGLQHREKCVGAVDRSRRVVVEQLGHFHQALRVREQFVGDLPHARVDAA